MPVYAYKAQCWACLSHNTAGRLHELKMPVLIAAGAKDLFMNIEKTMELVHGIPQAEFYLAPEVSYHGYKIEMREWRKQNNVYRYEYVD